ncbi:proteasome assembly chaperone family protein [Halococcoides cellulosivorans]|uniref:3-isopropylmalate dehydratase n=1 Tax=Halococcoides cellulosivorans TaxID=1679096 RepID=A0A2R4X0H3_9EURY|nr:PAC2 family protein [Halococcoides cellulosivorans]AWB27276.1 3-isopropylmalate dehydratase [Halococcoides cellulosivorans]
MAHVDVHAGIDLSGGVLIDGLPGQGLVGKIAADHLVESLDLAHVGTCHCDGLPEVATYRTETTTVRAPVRIHADESGDVIVLQSDVPVSPSTAEDFAACLTQFLDDEDILPLYVSGKGVENGDSVDDIDSVEDVDDRQVIGVATGDASGFLTDLDVDDPADSGAITGPTGALLYAAIRQSVDAVGIIVETTPQFPDPEAARQFLDRAIVPITGIGLETESLIEQAEEIGEARERLAREMSQGGDESSSVQPIGFQ